MLHLAQVQNNDSLGGVELRLLARKQSEYCWALINQEKNVPLTSTDSLNEDLLVLNEGLLVLVELSENQEVQKIQHAKDWVLDFVQQYLTVGITPAFLQEEVVRTEQWRQDLTLQSQDLTRQRTEMEARREQIQTLEEELIRKQQQLEEREALLKNQTNPEMEARCEQIQALEEELKRKQQQLEEREVLLKNQTNSNDTDLEDL